MISTILSLLGGSLGGILRFIPEILKIFTAGKDRAHEYQMTRLQLDIDKARSEQGIDLVHAQSESAQGLAALQAYTEAIKSQGQLTGVGWVDAVNATVRPFITYWWMGLLSVHKVASLVVAWRDSVDFAHFVPLIWSAQDAGVLSMIIGFWFCDRAIKWSGK